MGQTATPSIRGVKRPPGSSAVDGTPSVLHEDMLNRFNIAVAMAHRSFRFADFGKKGSEKTVTGKDLGKMH